MFDCRAARTPSLHSLFFFFFNDTATTEIYTLSLHDALPISGIGHRAIENGEDSSPLKRLAAVAASVGRGGCYGHRRPEDRKSTRLNSSHLVISYAVFCLEKKKTIMVTAHAYAS